MDIYTISVIIFTLYAFRDWLVSACDSIELYLLKRPVLKKKIKVEVNHAGNQEIPEFYDRDGNKKCITFEIAEDSTIAEVKDAIAKQVKYVDRTISLFKKPFGKKLSNSRHIICFHNTDPLILYIVIPNY
jgi:hypothetical protein